MKANWNYAESIAALHLSLGIEADYARRTGLVLQPEATELVTADTDLSGRERQLTPSAAQAWLTLYAAAVAAGHSLQLISAFRSVAYQRGIIERKRAKGLTWAEIFRFSAAPGYSEHHTGRAIDVGTPGCPPLTEAFAQTPAFAWLAANAPAQRWRLSFPADNPHGVAYEPWHWFWIGDQPIDSSACETYFGSHENSHGSRAQK